MPTLPTLRERAKRGQSDLQEWNYERLGSTFTRSSERLNKLKASAGRGEVAQLTKEE